MRAQHVDALATSSVHVLKHSDLSAVARVHSAAFPASALTKLGPEAVRRYYDWQLKGPHEVHALGAVQGERLAGFCFGGVFSGAISGFVRSNASFLMLAVLSRPWLIASPIFRERLRCGQKALGPTAVPAKPPSYDPRARPFDILSIAVDPVFQGLGIGSLLMRRAREIAIQKGFTAMTLMVNTDNEQAVRFYQGIGWEKSLMNGNWRGNMVHWLDSSAND